MSTAIEREGTVLVVDDDEDLADLYADYLREAFDVRTAYGGQAALDVLSPEIDVLLVDRRMPVVSGNEVIAAVEERGLETRIALVTAIDPDFDIVDLGIDDYLNKPVTGEAVRATVERLLAVDAYNDRRRDLGAKRVKRNVLAVEKHEAALRRSEEFARLTAEIERLEAELAEIESGFETQFPERSI